MYRSVRFNAVFVGGVLGFSAVLLLRRLLYLTQIGGGEFQHADWLINFSGGIVRRGISGEFFLALSDISGVSPLLLVSLVQGALTLLLIAAVFLKGLIIGMSDRMILMLLSPALILFWVNDTTGAFRKEMLGLVTFLPLLVASLNRVAVIVSVVILFAIAVFFHEANLVFAPALTFALYLRLGRQGVGVPAVLLWIIALVCVAFSAVYSRVPDVTAMCQRLLDAGLTDRLCYGIFPWLAEGFDGTTSSVSLVVLDRVNLLVVFLFVVLLLLPVFWIGWERLRTSWERLAFLTGICAIFALYPIATDWSRWLSMQVWAMTFIVLILAEKRGGLNQPVNQTLFVLLLSFNLGVGIDQIVPTPLAGFVYNAFYALEKVLLS